MPVNRPGEHSSVRQVIVDPEFAGQRLDNFLLRELGDVPRSVVYRIVRKGEVRANGGRVAVSYRLQAGDRIRIPPVRRTAPQDAASRSAGAASAMASRLETCILYEDRRLLVLNKPAGLAVHGGSGIRVGAIETLRHMRPDERAMELVHRLDRETSGCLLIAKKRSLLRWLHENLREHRMDKRYLALVKGDWQLGEQLIDAPLLTHQRRGGERWVSVDKAGKAARTRFRPIQLFGRWSLLEAELETGRTHQIRVHAAHAGHPLAGDPRYGDEEAGAPPGLERMFLHAHSVAFDWPDSGEPFHMSAPLDDALRGTIDRLEERQASVVARGRNRGARRP
ncbi:MAG: RluA family pseudouridine synthase [Pseudomonadota bacterium]